MRYATKGEWDEIKERYLAGERSVDIARSFQERGVQVTFKQISDRSHRRAWPTTQHIERVAMNMGERTPRQHEIEQNKAITLAGAEALKQSLQSSEVKVAQLLENTLKRSAKKQFEINDIGELLTAAKTISTLKGDEMKTTVNLGLAMFGQQSGQQWVEETAVDAHGEG